MLNSKHLKKALWASLLIAFLYTPTFAEEKEFPRNEVYLSYGYPQSAYTYVIYGLAGLGVVTTSGGKTDLKVSGAGSFNVGYNWFPLDFMAVGSTFNGEFFTIHYKDTETGKITDSDFMFSGSVQAKITFQYGGQWVKWYHGLSAGITFMAGLDSEAVPAFAFNLTPVGIKIGPKGKGFNGFVDVNLGTNSFVNAGALYTF